MRPTDRRSRPAAARLGCVAGFFLLLAGCGTPDGSRPAPAGTSAAGPPAAATPAPPPPALPATGRGDAFVLLSGGGTPTSNNYSQYLQARALAAYFRERYPPEAVWIFFGAGNRDGETPVLADVYRQVKADGLLLDTWLPGTLPGNRPATREAFLRALRTEILPRVGDGGTLYLFVGDHGELTRGRTPESAITMWGLRRDPAAPDGWAAARSSALGVAELRTAVAAGLGRGRVVFAMTQCHSGGFHGLGVAPEPRPPAAWFLGEPRWLAAPAGVPAAAGFTATDQESIAAGCDPAPDPDTWLGYERLLPEQLLGRDLLSGATVGTPRFPASFAAAHDAAVLLDRTLDKPRSTSEHALERWAALVETRLASELLLAPRVHEAVAAYRRAVDTGRFSASDPAWLAAHAVPLERLAALATQNHAVRRLLVAGTRAELEAAAAPGAAATDDGETAEDDTATELPRPLVRLWRGTLRPAWSAAVAAGTPAGLSPLARIFEERLLQLETRGRPPGFADVWPERALSELYWQSTYADPARFDPVIAAEVTRWAAVRRRTILAWAAASSDPALQSAAARFGPAFHRDRTPPAAPPPAPVPADTAAARVLFQRRILAAWEFLLALDHRPALAELQALRTLERTPLPER